MKRVYYNLIIIYHESCKIMCNTEKETEVLLRAHLLLSDEYGGAAQSMSSYLVQSGYDMDIYGDAPDKMTYTEQANKRSHCKRLTR